MTEKLSKLFNLASSNSEPFSEDELSSIEENRAIIEEVDLAIDKIDAALPFVNDLDMGDKELDELSDLAKENFADLMSLGMNVEARFSGHILATAGTLLGHAITDKIVDAEDGQAVILDRNELLKQILGAKSKD